MRFASAADAAALLAIYGQYLDTSVTFEQDLPSEEEFARRIGEYGGTHPYLVWEEGGRPVGYAYAHRPGGAGGLPVERGAVRLPGPGLPAAGGWGGRLYGALVELLRLQGVRTVCGCVTVPNARQRAAARGAWAFSGLRRVAATPGYKGGAWRDVAWFEKAHRRPRPGAGAPVRPIGAVPPAERAAAFLAAVRGAVEERKTRGASMAPLLGFGRGDQPLQTGTIQPLVSGSLPHWMPVRVS